MQKLTWLLMLLYLWIPNVDAATIPYGTPTVDGSINTDSEWKAAGHLRMARFYGSDQFADFWLLWDENNLYVAGKLQDYTLFEDGGGAGNASDTTNDDSVEIYIHPTNQAATALNIYSRVIAFTPTGKFRRLDRGTRPEDKQPEPTTGLEMPGNTDAKINDNTFFNNALWEQVCTKVTTNPNAAIIMRYAPVLQGSLNNAADQDIGWNFELAIPWSLLGTKLDTKITGNNCGAGIGVIPSTLSPEDGLNLQLNFYRVGDDLGGKVVPKDRFPDSYFKLSEWSKTSGRKADSSGVYGDEWFVYQGDRFNPSEWATFTLSGARHTADLVPHFINQTLTATVLDGRRANLQLVAPTRDNTGGAASHYEIRYQPGNLAVNETSWATMQVFENAYQPATPGTVQTLTLIGLQPGQTYTVAVRATDESGRITPEIPNTTITLPNSAENFVTVAPTGRSLVFSDNSTPFLVLGETGLMPWLPLRGLYGQTLGTTAKDPNATASTINLYYNGFLCDEHYPIGDYNQVAANEKCKPATATEYGKWRNYYINKNNFPDEGEQVAIDYFAKLKANGINVLTVFVESLDLDITPIFFELSAGNYNPYVLTFLDHLVELARQNDVYLVLRLYDTYYYKDNFYTAGDSNGANKGRKWSDTTWAKQGKASPDNFFDEDLYPQHIQRMQTLFNWVNQRTGVAYKDEPHILGWDIVNEIDNHERFNTAPYNTRKNWLERMLKVAKDSAPKQLVFYSFLTWDPKDASYYRANIGSENITESNYLGLDAYLAYRVPNASIAAPHGYYAHIANPAQTPPLPDYKHPLELARGITYGFYQIRDGRPILDMEGAPNPLYIKQYNASFTQEDDKEMFFNSAWLHFVSGGAGANLRWPIDLTQENSSFNQIPEGWRNLLKIFKDNVGNILWHGDKLQIDHQKTTGDVFTVVRHDDSHAVAYVFNPNRIALTSLSLPSLAGTRGSVRAIVPSTGEVLYDYTHLSDLGTIPLPRPINEQVAVMIQDIIGKFGSSAVPPVPSSNTSNLPADTSARLKGISTRGYIGNSPEDNLFAGIIIGGSGSEKLLVRGLGQGLNSVGVTTNLDARLEIKNINDNSVVNSNDNWQTDASAAQLSQFAATPNSVLDAALVTSLNTGTYSIQVSPVGAPGVGLVEIFDKDLSTNNKLSGISTRGYVGNTPAEFMYAGISVQGNLKVLIRALGAGLQSRGITGALDDAKIVVRKGSEIIASNDSWSQDGSATELQQKQQAPPTMSDAAMFITLSEGDYTIEVSSAQGGRGVALVEIYDMP